MRRATSACACSRYAWRRSRCFTGTTLADASLGTPYTEPLLAWDNVGAVSYAVAGGSALPPGMGLSGSSLTGTPTTAGTYSFTLTLSDGSGITQNWTFSLRVSAISFTTPFVIPQQAIVGVPFSYTFTASGGGSTKTWTATGLPNGLSLSAAGVLSGTVPGPSGARHYPLTVDRQRRGNADHTELHSVCALCQPVGADAEHGQHRSERCAGGAEFLPAAPTPNGGTPPYTYSVAPGLEPAAGPQPDCRGRAAAGAGPRASRCWRALRRRWAVTAST